MGRFTTAVLKLTMKAFVIFSSVLVACSSHVINKRSLLGGRRGHSHGQGHHGHQQQHHGQRHGLRQLQNRFGQRTGRDGGHHESHDESANEIRAAPTGYLPAAADYDYEEDLAGYSAGTRSDDLAGYSNDDLSGYGAGAEGQASDRAQSQYGDDQQQYGDEQYDDGEGAEVRDGEEQQGQYGDYQDQYGETSGAEPKTAGSEDELSITADDGYGAPEEGSGDEDTDALAEAASRDVEGEYSAPPALAEAASRNVDTGYAAPVGAGAESDYSAPDADPARAADEEYGAPGEYTGSQNGFPFEIVEGQSRQGAAAGAPGSESDAHRQCPGGSIDDCVEVCPGITARVYRACVQGCADRCPEDQ